MSKNKLCDSSNTNKLCDTNNKNKLCKCITVEQILYATSAVVTTYVKLLMRINNGTPAMRTLCSFPPTPTPNLFPTPLFPGNVVYTNGANYNPQYLNDQDETTCNPDVAATSVTVALNKTVRFTWFRVLANNKGEFLLRTSRK